MGRILFLLVLVMWGSAKEAAVTYKFSGGRFGDCLLSYLHAKWIAYSRGIPLLYVPFEYSEELVLSTKEKRYRKTDPNVFICPYFPEGKWDQQNSRDNKGRPWQTFSVDWKDEGFRCLVRELVAPKRPLQVVVPPVGYKKVALHVREGGGFDANEERLRQPLKLPPLEYYIECLSSVVEEYRGEAVYCYVFTDALDPKAIVEKLQQSLPIGVLFDYRREGNRHDVNVLEDFFSFFNFDVLIRSQSNYSLIPSLIHDFERVYSPKEFVREGDAIRIILDGIQ